MKQKAWRHSLPLAVSLPSLICPQDCAVLVPGNARKELSVYERRCLKDLSQWKVEWKAGLQSGWKYSLLQSIQCIALHCTLIIDRNSWRKKGKKRTLERRWNWQTNPSVKGVWLSLAGFRKFEKLSDTSPPPHKKEKKRKKKFNLGKMWWEEASEAPWPSAEQSWWIIQYLE